MIDAGNANVGVAVVHRPIAAKGQGGDPMQHANVIEIYYVLEGRAVMVTGGKVLNPRPFVQAIVDASSVGPSIRGPSADLAGSESKPIGPGDIIFIPVGTVHYLSEVTEPVTFLVYRIDPNKVTTTHSTPSPVVVP
jgi:mannose-6-phosphate isomerase-like protein (cupin superfamily)